MELPHLLLLLRSWRELLELHGRRDRLLAGVGCVAWVAHVLLHLLLGKGKEDLVRLLLRYYKSYCDHELDECICLHYNC
jgi:hypothetical protein